MTIDLWGLALQAINVLILLWLLTRVFWRPVAAAIEGRQKAAQSLLADADTAKTEADAVLIKVTKARDGIAAERAAALADAAEVAKTAAKQALAEASAKADTLAKAAELATARKATVNQAKNAHDAAQLAVEIAEKLLARLDKSTIQAMFLDLLIKAIEAMPAQDKDNLMAGASIDLVGPEKFSAAQKTKLTKAVDDVLGGDTKLTFVTEPDLIAGYELRSAHFILHNSWRADLDAILKGVKNAT